MTPQVIRGARWKALGLTAIGLGICAIALAIPERTSMVWATLIFFGLCTAVMLMAVIQPSTLTLDDVGFTYRGLFGRGFRVEWGNIEALHIWRNPVRQSGQALVGWTLKPGAPRPRGTDLSACLGTDGAVPGMWTLSPERVLEIMRDWHTRAEAEPETSPEG